MAELRFVAIGTPTLEEDALHMLRLRRGPVTPRECAAYIFHNVQPSEVHVREATSILCKLVESDRAKVVP